MSIVRGTSSVYSGWGGQYWWRYESSIAEGVTHYCWG
jgi:hypothetical protein